MSSKPQRNAQSSSSQGKSSEPSDRQSLPFEPTKSRKQTEQKAELKAAKQTSAKTTPKLEKHKTSTAATSTAATSTAASSSGIPDFVSRRMVKRMAVFCGIPTALGMSTFLVSYLVIVNDIYKIPTYAVLLLSLGFFGIGVLGLSYGALSASWEEETSGSRLGWSEFRTNWGRMTGAWKADRDISPSKHPNKP